jgi:hypothetical protein
MGMASGPILILINYITSVGAIGVFFDLRDPTFLPIAHCANMVNIVALAAAIVVIITALPIIATVVIVNDNVYLSPLSWFQLVITPLVITPLVITPLVIVLGGYTALWCITLLDVHHVNRRFLRHIFRITIHHIIYRLSHCGRKAIFLNFHDLVCCPVNQDRKF